MHASRNVIDLRIDGVLSAAGGAIVVAVGIASGATHTWVLVVAAALMVVLCVFGVRRHLRALADAPPAPADLQVRPRPWKHWLRVILEFACPLAVSFTWPLLTAVAGTIFACAGMFELIEAGYWHALSARTTCACSHTTSTASSSPSRRNPASWPP